MADIVAEITIKTSEGEVITYYRLDGGYWEATQEGMPDHWWLSRVAGRAVEELISVKAKELTTEEAYAVEYCCTNQSGLLGRPAEGALKRGRDKLRLIARDRGKVD